MGGGGGAGAGSGWEHSTADEVESRAGDRATPRWSSATGSDAVPSMPVAAPVADGHAWVSLGVTAVAAIIVGLTLKMK
jgi:hypothetical protein